MTMDLKAVDKLEILTLQDNYIDIAAMDNSEMVHRAMPLKDGEVKNSILAEHGFCALVSVTAGSETRSILFDFGFSAHGAAANADALDVDLSKVETLVLSHGHMDHFGGLSSLVERVGRKNLELILHPTAFRKPRYIKASEKLKFTLPALNKEAVQAAGVSIVESKDPRPLLEGLLLFLGEVPKESKFEKGFPRMYYDEDGQSHWDPIEDDTAIAANVRGKGLVVLSGCAHSGIINTVKFAQKTTGIDNIFAVMGGFHLTGADFEPIIEPTTQALKALDPEYVIPTHCTGRKATMYLEKEMPDQFLLNMSGTRMVFEGQAA